MAETARREWWRGTASDVTLMDVTEVTDAATRLLVRHGVAENDARLTAGHLVESSARGYRAHGIERISQLVAMLDAGTIRADARPRVRRNGTGVAIVEADHCLGPPAAAVACDLARTGASACGVGVAALRNAGHLGTLAPWAERCAGSDAFGLVCSSSEPGVVAPGGRVPVFGTNPIAYAWPSPTGGGSADFSTAAMTRSELLRRAETGDSLPPSVAVDATGQPTLRPDDALAGGLLPIGGGPKGALLSLLAALLAGPVAGGPASPDVRGTRRADQHPERADLFLVIDLATTTDLDVFGRAVDAMLTAATTTAFHRPGSASAHRRARAAADGIPVSTVTAALLRGEGNV